MKGLRARAFVTPLIGFLSVVLVNAADNSNITQADWDTRSASCPPKITQATAVVIRVTNVNDLLIDFTTGDIAEYQLRVTGSPVSVIPENPFQSQTAAAGTCPDDSTLMSHLDAVKKISDPKITPPQPGGTYIPLSDTIAAAHSHSEVTQVESDYGNLSCAAFFGAHPNDLVVSWIKRLDTQSQSGGNGSTAPAHSIDFNVNLEPNENYEFTIQASWKRKTFKDGTLQVNCGENDILTLSLGPIVTTVPYRTYNQQQVPTPTGTQNELVVSGTANSNVLVAALLNFHFPQIPHVPSWTGFALSVGPVYTLNSTPTVSKLGLFVGMSIHMYRSIFLTPGVHIGEFADFPAGFVPGSVIPAGFGTLTPVTRNTAHFAIGITFKTTSFKKSSQNSGAATNTPNSGGTGGSPGPAQQVAGNKGGTPSITVSSLALQPTSIVGGNPVQGTVTLSGPAPANGLVVNLSAMGTGVTIPPSITVPSGQVSSGFTITTNAVTASTSVNVKATSGTSSQSTSLTILPM